MKALKPSIPPLLVNAYLSPPSPTVCYNYSLYHYKIPIHPPPHQSTPSPPQHPFIPNPTLAPASTFFLPYSLSFLLLALPPLRRGPRGHPPPPHPSLDSEESAMLTSKQTGMRPSRPLMPWNSPRISSAESTRTVSRSLPPSSRGLSSLPCSDATLSLRPSPVSPTFPFPLPFLYPPGHVHSYAPTFPSFERRRREGEDYSYNTIFRV